MTAVTISMLGAARAVTGSAHHVRFGDTEVLVDCGLVQGERGAAEQNRRPPLADPQRLAAVVLTHAHLDHVGRLPLLVREGYDGPIFGQPATLAITEVVLRDALKVATRNGEVAFSQDDLHQTIAQMQPLRYGVRREVGPVVQATLFDAGHILGSSSVLLEGAGRAVLLSGDLGRRGTPILRDPNLLYPSGLEVDAVVVESTYGDREHEGAGTIHARLRDILRRALRDGGKVIIPAFSIGRTQELLHHLAELRTDGELAEVPVVVDGPMGLDVTAIYERHRDCYDDEARHALQRASSVLSFPDLYSARGVRGSEAARSIPGPAIIIAGNGMCSGGRVLGYLEDFLPDARTDVLFVGYQARGTLGRALVDGARSVAIEGRTVSVRAQVTRIAGLSAHADRAELLDWLARVPGGGRRVFVGHGEADVSVEFAAGVRSRLALDATVPERGAVFEVVP